MAMSNAERQRRYRQRKKARESAQPTIADTNPGQFVLDTSDHPAMVRGWLEVLDRKIREDENEKAVLDALRCTEYLERHQDSGQTSTVKQALDRELAGWGDPAPNADLDLDFDTDG